MYFLTVRIFCKCTGGLERRAPSLAELGNDDIPKDRRSPLRVSHATHLDANMLPCFSNSIFPYRYQRSAFSESLHLLVCG